MIPRAGKAREATEWDEEPEEVEDNWMLIESSSQRNSILAAPDKKAKNLNMTQKLKQSELNDIKEPPV
jgi:hypothetical protein